MRLPIIPLDKLSHLWAGWAIVATLLPYVGPWAMVAAVLAGAAKELWDATSETGTCDPSDFWATVAGGVCAGMADLIVQLIF